MGGVAKALLPLRGQSLLEHALERLIGQVSFIAISANDPGIVAAYPILIDAHDDRRGPLAGLLAGMVWAEAHGGIRWIVSVPVDCPFLPRKLVAGLRATARATGAQVVVAASGGTEHPTMALWDLTLLDALRPVVEAGTDLSVRRFYQGHQVAFSAFEDTGIDPFFNINTPEDLARAEDACRVGEDLEAVITGNADEGHADGLGLAHGEQGGRRDGG